MQFNLNIRDELGRMTDDMRLIELAETPLAGDVIDTEDVLTGRAGKVEVVKVDPAHVPHDPSAGTDPTIWGKLVK